MQLTVHQQAALDAIAATQPGQIMTLARERTVPRSRNGLTTVVLHALVGHTDALYLAVNRTQATNAAERFRALVRDTPGAVVNRVTANCVEYRLANMPGMRMRVNFAVLAPGYPGPAGPAMPLSMIAVDPVFDPLRLLPIIAGAGPMTTVVLTMDIAPDPQDDPLRALRDLGAVHMMPNNAFDN